MKSFNFGIVFLILALITVPILGKGVKCGLKKAGQYCASSQQCPVGYTCCTYCPSSADICGPDTEYRPYCQWGPCGGENDPNFVEFIEMERVY